VIKGAQFKAEYVDSTLGYWSLVKLLSYVAFLPVAFRLLLRRGR
jgi:ABC-type polysaccharide/polyol phosphate export permease